MRSGILAFLFLLSSFSLSAQNFGGNPSAIKWYQVNTDKARVIFPAGLDSQAKRIAGIMKLLGDSTAGSIGGRQKKWNVILQNQSTISNAYVRMAPVMSEFYMMTGQDNFSFGSLRWDDNLAIHENRHMQQLSNFNKGFTKVFSFFLGEEGQLLANGMTIPDYFFEGDAVWQETLVSAQGRGRMTSFYNGFKSLWLADKNYSWMKLRNGSYKDLVPDHYELGYQLTAYGYEKYGAGFWNKVTNDAVRFRSVFYPFNRAVERYSGKTYRQFTKDAMQYFKNRALPAQTKAATALTYLTEAEKNNVIDYRFATFINDDSILVTKRSYKAIPAFCIISKGKETSIRLRDIGIDDYYSYRNGKVVYAAYQSDPRWTNREYSVIKLLDMYTGRQRQITSQSRLFSPDINEAGTEILAVEVKPDGSNHLVRIDAQTGKQTATTPNSQNYFFTQSKFINSGTAVSAARSPEGTMALITIDLTNGTINELTPFSYNVIGYPFVRGDVVYFNAMYDQSDAIFAVNMTNKKIYKLTENNNGVYSPAVNEKGELLLSAFTSNGYRLASVTLQKESWTEFSPGDMIAGNDRYFAAASLQISGKGILAKLKEADLETAVKSPVTKYRKSFRLFNFHSWRPVVADPEYGYSLYGDNVLSSFKSAVTYTYNRSDMSHTLGFNAIYAGWFPVLNAGVETSFNRTVDTALGKSVSYNAATVKAGISVPLRFINGRTSKFLNFGAGYNSEQYYYRGVGKNVFSNNAINYGNAFFSFSNISQKARQHINPRWAQSLSLDYRDAFNFRNSYKFVGHASFYLPGIARNHSLVINTAYQKRDTMADLFSKNFAYSRGYEALSTRRMYKVGVNYQLPVVYPDWGFANLLYFQRVRANAFYDYTNAKARVNNVLTEIKNRSTGAEVYFDTKIWNAYPVSFGVRFSHLLDTDLLNPLVKNRWEIIIPIGLIPD